MFCIYKYPSLVENMRYSFCCFLFQIPKCIYQYEMLHSGRMIQIIPNYSLFEYQKEEDLFRYNSKYRRQFKNNIYNHQLVDNHHIIPKQFQSHRLLQELNVDVACSKNILFMRNRYAKQVFKNSSYIYHDSHRKYNQFVERELQSIASLSDIESRKYQFCLLFMYLNRGIIDNDPYIKSLFS